MTTPFIIDYAQEHSKCSKCNHEFRAGDGILLHFIQSHTGYIFKLLVAGEVALNLQNDIRYDPDTLDFDKPRKFEAPRCKNCDHDDPDYICISNDDRGIRMKCIWCKNITVKD